VTRGVLDEPLARDILFFDFTRPVFSDQRCALLESVRDAMVTSFDPATIRKQFADRLPSRPKDEQSDAVRKFLQRCGDRAQHDPAVLDDLMAVWAAKRTRARADLQSRFGVGILPFPASLALGDLEVFTPPTTYTLKDPDPSQRAVAFSPVDCARTTR
jgi:hypothetical protein